MTPHISAKKGEIAEVVLLFGDPVRCRRSAEKYLSNCKEVSSVRGACYFTGEKNGKRFTFGTSGMGCGSMGIYSYELFNFYDVQKIIRVGTSGAYSSYSIGDKILVTESVTDDPIFSKISLGYAVDVAKPSDELLGQLRKSASSLNIKLHEGRVHSTDLFYFIKSLDDIMKETQAQYVEMESYALFINAQRTKKQAACMVCITDTIYSGQHLTPDERVLCCDDLIETALNIEV